MTRKNPPTSENPPPPNPASGGPRSKAFPIRETLEAIRKAARGWPTPAVTVYGRERASPFMILVSTVLSLRTRDSATAEASQKLFALARTPGELAALAPEKVEAAIRAAGFYRTKARTLVELARTILEEHGGETPDTVEELLKLKGVGRKTANLVVTLGHGKPGICVDTHVHRIANRWGYIKTKTPDETEMKLRRVLPPEYWIPINDWLVAFGQNLCHPVSPRCSVCPVAGACRRIGVTKSR